MISGIIMAFERPVKVGDVVQVTSLNLMGEVKEIGLRSSHIQTFEGAIIVVPNGNLISSEVINWTLSDRNRRYEINVGVKYGSDLKQVLGILKETVEHNEAVLVNPGPMILFDGFGESSLNFRVLFWLSLDSGLRVRSEVGIAIDEALKKAGIEIPFPQRDVHVRTADVKAAGTAQQSSLPSLEDRPA
jgi:small-conductance mechanosensitive channel